MCGAQEVVRTGCCVNALGRTSRVGVIFVAPVERFGVVGLELECHDRVVVRLCIQVILMVEECQGGCRSLKLVVEVASGGHRAPVVTIVGGGHVIVHG